MGSAGAETQPMPEEMVENVEDTQQEEDLPQDRKQKHITKIND